MTPLRIVRPSWNNNQEHLDRIGRAKKFPIEKMYEGKLRKIGRVTVGLCPWHEEDTPSFVVYPENNTWYCFACSVGGDAISFYIKKTGSGFVQAIEELTK